MRLARLLLAGVLASTLVACESLQDALGPGSDTDPTDLTYRVIPSGDPDVPSGVLLTWSLPRSTRVVSFDVYARNSTGASWTLRATTTSPSFHDAGIPQLQYYVASIDDAGIEMGRSERITVEDRSHLPAPTGLRTTSLNRAVHLAWSSNAHDADPVGFDGYRVYSAPYDAPSNSCVRGRWVLEGTTVSDAFVATNLANGASRCFAVSAVSRTGQESAWSEARLDTPRPDGRFVVVSAVEARPGSAGFLFADAQGRQFGIVTDGTRTDVDFRLERRADGSLWMRMIRPDVRVAIFGSAQIPELSTIDRALTTASYGAGAVELVAGWGYLFTVRQADGMHYAAIRVSYVATDHAVIDWAYQTAAGNPELTIGSE
jgi:hypothetical protein